MKNFLAVLSLSLVVNGCGLLDFGQPAEQGSFRPYDSEQQLLQDFQRATAVCEVADCPEQAAAVYIIKNGEDGERGLFQCSGTLIDHSKVLTNAHCLPAAQRLAGEACQGLIRVAFPQAAGHRPESYDCLRVAAVSADHGVVTQPDWAVLELAAQTQRRPAVVNTSGVQRNSTLTLHRMNFRTLRSAPVPTGSLETMTCRGNINHIFNMDFLGPVSPLMNLSHCTRKVFTGNSGTGIFNSANELVAVFSYALPVEDNEDQAEILEEYPNLRQNFGGGTNLACVEYFNPQASEPDCYYGSKEQQEDLAWIYGELARLRAGDAYGPTVEALQTAVLNIDDSPVEWVMDTALVLENLEVEDVSVGRELRRRIHVEAMQTLFPALPRCVHGNGFESFEVRVPYLIRGERDVDPVTHLVTLEALPSTMVWTLEPDDQWYYRAQPRFLDFIPAGWKRDLVPGEDKDVFLKIPRCGVDLE
jgi:hypothetical protein